MLVYSKLKFTNCILKVLKSAEKEYKHLHILLMNYAL